MKDMVTVNGIRLSRCQVEAALAELNKPDEPTVPLVNGDVAIFPLGHPMRDVIQVRGAYPSQYMQGLYLSTAFYDFHLEVMSGCKFLWVARKT